MIDTVCQIDWTREDIASILSDSGKEATEEAVARFIESFDWKYFQDKAIQDGFEMLKSGVDRNTSL